MLAGPNCPASVTRNFAAGAAPPAICTMHRGGGHEAGTEEQPKAPEEAGKTAEPGAAKGAEGGGEKGGAPKAEEDGGEG
jgi:hypothetical protein